MRRVGAVTVLLAASAVNVLSGCGPLDRSHWVTGHVPGDKTFALDLVYGGNSSNLAVGAYADVPDSTDGIVEVTGTQHWRCQGQFRKPRPNRGVFPWDNENLPGLTLGSSTDPAVNFSIPKGSYTVTARIPAMKAEVKESATLDRGYGASLQLVVIPHDPDCTLIADTRAQQKAFITQYLDWMKLAARSLGKPDLTAIVDQARQENAAANELTDPVAIVESYAKIDVILLNLVLTAAIDFPEPPTDLRQAVLDTMSLLHQRGLP
jgi:hypothetical protein